MSIRKAENGIQALDENDLKGQSAQTLRTLLTQYIETGNKQMWKAAKIWAKAVDYDKYLGYLPHYVMKVINNVTEMVYDESITYYANLQHKMGYIPFNVRNRWLYDREDQHEKEFIQCMALSKTKANSVERFLKKSYQMGQWDGRFDTVPKLYNKHQYILMDGNYNDEYGSGTRQYYPNKNGGNF